RMGGRPGDADRGHRLAGGAARPRVVDGGAVLRGLGSRGPRILPLRLARPRGADRHRGHHHCQRGAGHRGSPHPTAQGQGPRPPGRRPGPDPRTTGCRSGAGDLRRTAGGEMADAADGRRFRFAVVAATPGTARDWADVAERVTGWGYDTLLIPDTGRTPSPMPV